VTYTWVRRGQRKRMAYENPQGRRLNVLAAAVLDGPAPALHWIGYAGTWRGDHIVRALEELLADPAADGRPTIVVLDNASIHHSRIVHDALPDLAARGVRLFYLPPYTPELNAIERIFRAIKHHHLPERRYTTIDDLAAAVDRAFTEYEELLVVKHTHQPGLAA
jgi:putative transposase